MKALKPIGWAKKGQLGAASMECANPSPKPNSPAAKTFSRCPSSQIEKSRRGSLCFLLTFSGCLLGLTLALKMEGVSS